MNKLYTLAEFSDIEKSVPLYETKKMTNRGYERIPKNTTLHINPVQPYSKPPLGKSIAMLVAAPLLAGGAAYLLEKSKRSSWTIWRWYSF